jgi:hypothetical protein
MESQRRYAEASMRRSLSVLLLLVACGTEPREAGGPVALSFVGGTLQHARVGTELPDEVAVRVVDAADRALAGEPVTFVSVLGGGHVVSGTVLTDQAGEARERWVLGTTSGQQVLEARVVNQASGESILSARVTATGDPGPAVSMTITPHIHVLYLNEKLDIVPLVRVDDLYGNEIKGLPVEITSGGGMVVEGTSISSGEELITQVLVASGKTRSSMTVTVLRNLADLVGATGSYGCQGDRSIDDLQLPRYFSTFVVDSVIPVGFRGQGATMWVTEDVDLTDAGGANSRTTRITPFPIGGQAPGIFTLPQATLQTPEDSLAVQVIGYPITYMAEAYCNHQPNFDSYWRWTLTKE